MSRLKDAFMTIEKKYHSLKVQFVQTLPKLLAFNQWNNKLLADTEEECGFVKGYCHIIFPGGIREIVDFFENWQDQNMLDLLSQQETPIKIRDKIDLALRIRIKDCTPKLIHLKNRSYFTTPSNSIFATKIAFRTCDLIWRYVGDKSIDYNYYTKRGLLLSVYITSILYYIQDESENNVDTDQYITKSLSNIITMTSNFKNMLKLPNPVDIPIIRLFL